MVNADYHLNGNNVSKRRADSAVELANAEELYYTQDVIALPY